MGWKDSRRKSIMQIMSSSDNENNEGVMGVRYSSVPSQDPNHSRDGQRFETSNPQKGPQEVLVVHMQ